MSESGIYALCRSISIFSSLGTNEDEPLWHVARSSTLHAKMTTRRRLGAFHNHSKASHLAYWSLDPGRHTALPRREFEVLTLVVRLDAMNTWGILHSPERRDIVPSTNDARLLYDAPICPLPWIYSVLGHGTRGLTMYVSFF